MNTKLKQFVQRKLPAIVSASLLAAGSFAEDNNFALEEILVTAQKRAESVQDVPVAISAFNEEMFESTGVNKIADIIPMIPGVSGSTYATMLNTWSIRGISSSDWTLGSEPSVAVFVDDAYIARNTLATGALYDVNRVEVVKGPQGTLFGRNAAAGAISIVTNKPTDENTAEIAMVVGDEGKREYDLVGNLAINDELAVRAAFHGSRLEGIWEDVVNNEEGFEDRDDFRISALWMPLDNLEVFLAYNQGESTSNMGQPYSSVGNVESGASAVEYPDKIGFTRVNRTKVDHEGVNLRLTWDISDDLSLTSISDWRTSEMSHYSDADANANDVVNGFVRWAALSAATIPGFDPFTANPVDPANPFSGLSLGATSAYNLPLMEQESFYQEFRLNGGSDTLTWFVGASYFQEDGKQERDVIISSTASAADLALLGLAPLDLHDLTDNDSETESLGVYGDASWHLTDDLTLRAGVRWSQDKKDWCSNGSADMFFFAMNTVGDLCASEKWSEITSRLVVDYALTDDILLYASVAEGYKGGGFNASALDTNGDFVGDEISSFDPETGIAYEVGMKSTLLDGRMQLNASAFINNYEDLQVLTESAGGSFASNAAEAEINGVELEGTLMVTEKLMLMANYAYLDADFTKGSVDTLDPSTGAPTVFVVEGRNLASAPEHSYSVAINYDMEFFDGTLNFFSMYNWQDDQFHEVQNSNLEEDYGLLSGRITYTPYSEAWSMALAVDNATDEEYAVWRFNPDGLTPSLVRGMPRIWSLSLSANF